MLCRGSASLIVFTIFLNYVTLTVSNDTCTTPTNKIGKCVVLDKCAPLLNLIKQKPLRDPQVSQLLKRSHCGFVHLLPKVCCEIKQCLTPDNQTGQCVPHTECAPLEKYLRSKASITYTDLRYLRKFECRTGNEPSRICCPFDKILGPRTITDETINKNIDSTNRPVTEKNTVPTPGAWVRSQLLPEESLCGIELSTIRIIGGEQVGIDQFPWLALLEYDNGETVTLGCGGSLISSNYILTAAHCNLPASTRFLGPLTAVRLGEHNLKTNPDCVKLNELGELDCNEPYERIEVDKIIVHPDFSERLKTHDIALIKLKTPVRYTDFIKPICLPNSRTLWDPARGNLNMTVAGWGQTENATQSEERLKLDLPVLEKARCESIYSDPQYYRIPVLLGPGQFCAGGQAGKDSCKGDSGGPLMMSRELPGTGTVWYQTGVVSFGPTPCARENVPGVYTNVMDYMPWINSIVEEG